MNDTALRAQRAKQKAQRLGGGVGDGNGLSWPSGYAAVAGGQEANITTRDAEILRELAKRVALLAALPEQAEKRELWTAHNDLTQTRPLIFCDPENAWYELIPADALRCEGMLARVWEFKLRKEIYWAEEIRDDRVTETRFPVYYACSLTDRGLQAKMHGGAVDTAYAWEGAIRDYAEIDRLRPAKIVIDYEKTNAMLGLAHEVFDGILDVTLEGSYWWSFGLTSDLILLRGFEQVLLDMYDNPDGLHRLMAFLRDEALTKLDFLENSGLLSRNDTGDFIGTGGYGYTNRLPQPGFDPAHVTTMDMWGFSESQESVGVSPELFAEFIFPYQNAILQRFGRNIYGCCEPLDKRWDTVREIPRLARVTVSPWSDPFCMAEKLGRDYVYVRKINPSYMATPVLSEEDARRELRETFTAAYRYGCPAEVLLRDVVTLSWNPYNAIRWTELAREEIENVCK